MSSEPEYHPSVIIMWPNPFLETAFLHKTWWLNWKIRPKFLLRKLHKYKMQTCFNFPILLYFLFSNSQMWPHKGRETNSSHVENEENDNWWRNEVEKSWDSYGSMWGPKLLEVSGKLSKIQRAINSGQCLLQCFWVVYFASVQFSGRKFENCQQAVCNPIPAKLWVKSSTLLSGWQEEAFKIVYQIWWWFEQPREISEQYQLTKKHSSETLLALLHSAADKLLWGCSCQCYRDHDQCSSSDRPIACFRTEKMLTWGKNPLPSFHVLVSECQHQVRRSLAFVH